MPDDVEYILDWNATLAKFEEIHAKLRAVKGSLTLIFDHYVPVPNALDHVVHDHLNTFRVPTYAKAEQEVLERSVVSGLSDEVVAERVARHNVVLANASESYRYACDDLFRLTQRTKEQYSRSINAGALKAQSKIARLFRYMKNGNRRKIVAVKPAQPSTNSSS